MRAPFMLALPLSVLSIPLEQRQACPNVHVFGARETTVPSGYGSAGTFVNLILNAYSGATAEVINYPAQGGTNDAYAASVRAGTQVCLIHRLNIQSHSLHAC
jgi:acetylxylan esterase